MTVLSKGYFPLLLALAGVMLGGWKRTWIIGLPRAFKKHEARRQANKVKKKRTYNTRLIKDDYSYYVEEVADLFGVDVATVRRWIREKGLERIPNTRPHLIHSTALRVFAEKKQGKNKKPCAPNEAFCFRCQTPRPPQAGSASAIILANSSIRVTAQCSVCCGTMHRAVRGMDWNEKHPLAAYLRDALGEHNRVQSLPREYPLQREGE